MFGPKTLASISFTTKHRRVPYNLPLVIDFWVVGGGGTIGAANGGGYYSGGGGGGGFVCSGQALQGGGGNAQPAIVLNAGQTLTCTPAGEAAADGSYYGTQGSASTLIGSNYSFSADGGGKGAGLTGGQLATVGASGGGGGGDGYGAHNAAALGTANQGYGGGGAGSGSSFAGGGGGGAGGAGTAGSGNYGGNGGLGLAWIDGNVYAYGGRGGRGAYDPGGFGAYATNRPSGGAPNRGAGSGRTVDNDASGGTCYGGAGVVILAYFGQQIATGGTITKGLLGKTYHTFTTSGTFTVTG